MEVRKRRSINQHRSMAEVSKQFIWKLGRGDQILLLEDSLVDGGITLKEKYLQLYRISLQRLQTVADLGGNGSSLGGEICLIMRCG